MEQNARPETKKPNVMEKIAAFIVNKRAVFFVIFIAACIYSALSLGRVRINPDITAFLPDDTETRRGIVIMQDEFTSYAAASVMVANVTYDRAGELAQELADIDGIMTVGFDDSAAHYKNSAALFSLTFEADEDDPMTLAAMAQVKKLLGPYDTYISSRIGFDMAKQLAGEMVWVVLIAALVIIAVLLLTSRSYFEVIIFFIVFIVAALLNMGTNHLLGEISSITNAIAVILQLALAIDYAIIFCHRYQDEQRETESTKKALTRALSKAIIEISSSSLTTLSGLAALTMMQFRLGYDLGVVLSKGIVCSMLTVFLLMPGLIMLFPRQLKATLHKSLVPDIRPWGALLARRKYLFSGIFLIILPLAIYCSGNIEYAFAEGTIDQVKPTERRMTEEKIRGAFDDETLIAVLVPRGDYEGEKAILDEVGGMGQVRSAVGLANVEIEDGRYLADPYTPRMFSELADIDVEAATLLYQAYGVAHEEYQPVFSDASGYAVPLVDMFLYLFDLMDRGVVTLPNDSAERIDELRGTLTTALGQLRGENWCRMAFTAAVPEEGPESVQLVEDIRAAVQRQYPDGDTLVIGNITVNRDLAESFRSDNWKISLMTILFVFIILLLTFRSVVAAALLVFVIQGSIFINFSFPFITGTNVFFVTYLIVSAIQMGATIDYAIVIMNRYQTLRETLTPKEAVAETMGQSFPTVFTSGSIMCTAGFLIAYMTSDIYVASIGLALGRGTLISIILVLTVLPQLIYILDKPIAKTRFSLGRILGGGE